MGKSVSGLAANLKPQTPHPALSPETHRGEGFRFCSLSRLCEGGRGEGFQILLPLPALRGRAGRGLPDSAPSPGSAGEDGARASRFCSLSRLCEGGRGEGFQILLPLPALRGRTGRGLPDSAPSPGFAGEDGARASRFCSLSRLCEGGRGEGFQILLPLPALRGRAGWGSVV
jgi:hypothetical protein